MRAVLFVGLACGAAHAATPDAKRACVVASDRAQERRSRMHLRLAREDLVTCTQSTCPEVVRRQCEVWLREVEESQPSIVVRLRDTANHDLTAARLLVDGELVSAVLDGRAVPVDPGSHLLRLEPEGEKPVEQTVLIIEGERNRIISEVVAAPVVVVAPPQQQQGVLEPVEPARPVESKLAAPTVVTRPARAPLAAWVLAAEGVISLGAFIGLAIWGQQTYGNCEVTSCSDSTRTSISVARALAWSALAVGVASVALSAWLFLSAEPTVVVSVAPLPGGSVGTVSLRF
jgi:hypothetical protein